MKNSTTNPHHSLELQFNSMINFVRVPKDYNSGSNVIITEVLVGGVMKSYITACRRSYRWSRKALWLSKGKYTANPYH